MWTKFHFYFLRFDIWYLTTLSYQQLNAKLALTIASCMRYSLIFQEPAAVATSIDKLQVGSVANK